MLLLLTLAVALVPDLVVKIVENVVSGHDIKRAEREVLEKLHELRHRSRHLSDVPDHFRDQARKRDSKSFLLLLFCFLNIEFPTSSILVY